MDRRGRGYRRSRHRGSSRGGRHGGRGEGGGPSRGGGARSSGHQPQPPTDGSWSAPREDAWRGGHGRGRGGRGRSGARGGRDVAGRSNVWVPSEPVHSHISAPDPVPQIERLQISEQLPATCAQETTGKILPVHRPDNGGKLSIRKSALRVNHFPLKFRLDTVIMHYNVDVRPVAPATARHDGSPRITARHDGSPRIPKSDLSMIREKLFSDNPTRLPLEMTAYDGEKNIFSAVPLPEETFTVTVSAGEDERPHSYTVTLTLVNTLELRKLKEYLNKESSSIPRDILQGMDIVFKENPAKRTFSLGRSFYPMNPPLLSRDLQRGIIAIGGFQQSLKPTSQGLSLCLDCSVLSFRKKMPVLDFLRDRIAGFRLEEFQRFKTSVGDELKELKVNVTHRNTRRKYTIRGLTDRNTRLITFPFRDPEGQNAPQEVRIVDYFQERYKRVIVHQDIPCLDVGNDGFMPMEFCVLVEGQRYPKENVNWSNASKTLKELSLASPTERKNYIQMMVGSGDGPSGGGIIQNFGMEIDKTMTSVDGRIIEPPQLKLRGQDGQIMSLRVDAEKCHWNLVRRSVVRGKPVKRWAVIDFTSMEVDKRLRLRRVEFIGTLMGKFEHFKIGMSEPVWVESSSMQQLESYSSLSAVLQKVYDKGQLQFILCVMAATHPGYKLLKWISETKLGIVTQCCLSSTVNALRDQNLTNIALKINAKLGGSNVELESTLPCFEGNGHIMFIGADVNHPAARDFDSLSIAATVATVNWPAANRYVARVRPQPHRKEHILNFGTFCLELVNCYEKLNRVRPEKIVIFRDGVSEGQFDMVLNEELQDVKNVFQQVKYSPTITLIVAQKRHHTRFFRDEPPGGNVSSGRNVSSGGNVSPGTVVDTKIVHPFEFDFYLCSHYGNLGTSKPTHYYVLWDEHSFTSDSLQKLIYDMCFTFARCTKPVSLVPPVYYADLVAYRGRLYYEAKNMSENRRSSSVPSSSTAADDPNYFKLHEHLEDEMFFV